MLILNFFNVEFSRFAVYSFLAISIILFLVFRGLNYFLPALPLRKTIKKPLIRYFPVAELFVWLVFFIWGIQYFIKNNQWYAFGLFLILFMLIAWITWYALKDIIAGIIFKSSEDFSINETIRFRELSGKIIRFRQRTIELETENGEIIILPYSKLLSETIIKSNPAELVLSHKFNVQIKKEIPVSNAIKQLNQEILHLPWASVKKNPSIKPVYEDDEKYTLELTIYTLEKEYFYKIESHIKSVVEKLNSQ